MRDREVYSELKKFWDRNRNRANQIQNQILDICQNAQNTTLTDFTEKVKQI